MAAASQASPDNIDVVALVKGLGRRWRMLGGVTFAAGALAFAGLSLSKPTFTSEAQIAIVARGDANPFADPKGAPGVEAVAVRVDREAINTHAKALQAPEIAQRISAELKLASLPEFNAAAGANGIFGKLKMAVGIGKPRAGESDEDRVLASFARKLVVAPAKDTRTILVRFSAQDRDLAAEIANRVGEAYRERLAQRAVGESDDVQKGLMPRIERLKQEATEAEAAIEKFRGAANLFRGGQSSLNDQQLSELAAAETKARTEHGEAEARARAARELEARGSGEVHPDVQKSPILQKLVQDRARIEGDIAKATATMKEGHPAMKQLRSELTSTERQIALEIRRVIDGLEKEVSVAAMRLASVRRTLSEMKAKVVDTGGDQAKLSQLEANARAKRGELERLQAQFESNRARSDARIVPVEVQFVSRARAAGEPSFPKPLPYTGLVMIAALMLAACLSIAKDLIAGARPARPARERRAADAVAEKVEPRLSAVASEESVGEADTDLSQPIKVGSVIELANRLVAKRTERQALRTLVAGAGVSVDPSAEAVELTRAVARAGGNVLLIDWSLDGAGVARLLGLPETPGISELVDGKSGFVGVIGRIPGSTGHLMPCGEGLASASGRGDVDRLNLVLDTLDEIYEQVIVAARFNAARDLFETIEGRFDVGVLIGEVPVRNDKTAKHSRTFLGFEVEDLDVIRLTRGSQLARSPVAERGRAA